METNVRLPPCVFDALAAVMAKQGASRDATVRRLLAEHVERQEQEHPDDRLTHISTVLRYPPPPRWRNDPRQDRPLRLRVSTDLLERARAISLRLPGQYQRAFRDYQGRMLTDAVVTAVAVAEPFTDELLDGLLPLLRHRAARNLWRLAAAALCTGPETELLEAAADVRAATAWTSDTMLGEDDQRLLAVVTALEEDVAWHSPARFQVVANIARDLLTGPQADANEQLLQEEGEAWNELHQDTLHADEEHRAYLQRGTTIYDWSGRGGTARRHRHQRPRFGLDRRAVVADRRGLHLLRPRPAHHRHPVGLPPGLRAPACLVARPLASPTAAPQPALGPPPGPAPQATDPRPAPRRTRPPR
ncbi:hypothetical protein AB0D27_43395 [Streptomyces sp. NPDC048415]|uniref:hypothetical protein n=1 Tax=Streptomyces sp. NPDC048415 TaxID=3154822 RepID=UPI00341C294E